MDLRPAASADANGPQLIAFFGSRDIDFQRSGSQGNAKKITDRHPFARPVTTFCTYPELGPYWKTMMRKNNSGVAEALPERRRRALRDAAVILRSWLVNETHAGEDLEGVPPDEWGKAGMLDCIQQIEKVAEEAK